MSDENPFEDLEDEVGDREGDPFEHLDRPDEESPDDESESESAEPPWEEPVEPSEEQAASLPEDDADTGPPEDDQPTAQPGELGTTSDPDSFSDGSTSFTEEDTEIGPEIGPPSDVTREGDPFDSMEDAFTERGVEDIDPDEVWEDLTDARARGSVSEKQGRTYAEVSKHSYCEQCEHFSEPPDIECAHEGTEIVEFLDMETVRLVDCPIVAKRKKLEDS